MQSKKNWLTHLFALKFLASKSANETIPNGLWVKCNQCNRILLKSILAKGFHVCQCGYHFRMNIPDRINMLFDSDFQVVDLNIQFQDPINFKDRKTYEDRFKDARRKTGAKEAFSIVEGSINGNKCVAMMMNFDFIGGSMGIAVGHGVKISAQRAIKANVPLIAFISSGGARMQEGLFSLMQMPKTVTAIEELKRHHLPFIPILTHPTTGGVLASFAMRGSITLAEPDSIIGFTGPRVIESITKVKLPDNFQTPEFLKTKGFVDHVVHRKDLKKLLAKILHITSNNNEINEIQTPQAGAQS